MKKYKIPVTWQSYGHIIVEGESAEDALNNARNDPEIPLPTESSYVEGSFQVEEDPIVEVE